MLQILEIVDIAKHEREQVGTRFAGAGERAWLAYPWFDRMTTQIMLATERKTPGLEKADEYIRSAAD